MCLCQLPTKSMIIVYYKRGRLKIKKKEETGAGEEEKEGQGIKEWEKHWTQAPGCCCIWWARPDLGVTRRRRMAFRAQVSGPFGRAGVGVRTLSWEGGWTQTQRGGGRELQALGQLPTVQMGRWRLVVHFDCPGHMSSPPFCFSGAALICLSYQ